jgi:hypothetical protein
MQMKNFKLQLPKLNKKHNQKPKNKKQADKVEQLRANEQVELKELLPNAELKADGKIDVENFQRRCRSL